MGYDKSGAKKANRYTFRWSFRYCLHGIGELLLALFLIGILGRLYIKDCFMPVVSHISAGHTASLKVYLSLIALGVIFLLLSVPWAIPFFRKIRCIEIESDKITLIRLIGKTTLRYVIKIEYVTRELLEEIGIEHWDDDDYEDGMSIRKAHHRSKRYGEFIQYCVNFDELAMVTLANDKKYLINYPKELFGQTPDIHVYKPKLNLKWRVGRVLAVISITSAFIALIALLSAGMFIEFFFLLLVTIFLLLPFGLSMIIETVKHIRIGRDRITILLSSHQKTIVLDNIESIQYVTRKELEPSTTYATQFIWFQRPRTCRGLSMWGKVFTNYKYGRFTRACNNFDELAMVTLANGKKYLINYPKELLEKK